MEVHNTLYLGLFILLYVTKVVISVTNIDGNITEDTALTKDKSPYLVSDGLVVTEGVTLEVETGVEIRFKPGRGLDVYGDFVIRGDEDDIARFTLSEDSIAENIQHNTSSNVRLTKKSREDRGILETEVNGVWSALCDGRTNDLSRYHDWMKNMAKVACRELGFPESQESVLVRHQSDSGGYVYGRTYDCLGTEDSLQECTMSTPWCYMQQNTIEIHCESVVFGYHWAGIRFHNTGTSTLDISNILVEKAGVRLNGNRTTISDGIFSDGRAINFGNSVTVEGSAGHGIFLKEMNDSVSFNNVTVEENHLDGVYLTTFQEKGRINAVKAEGNRNGIVVKRLNMVNFVGVDFCSITCIRCQHSVEDFPLELQWSKQEYQSPDCTKARLFINNFQ